MRWYIKSEDYDRFVKLFPIPRQDGDEVLYIAVPKMADAGNHTFLAWEELPYKLGQVIVGSGLDDSDDSGRMEIETRGLAIPFEWLKPLGREIEKFFGKPTKIRVLEAKLERTERHLEDLRKILKIAKDSSRQRDIDL